VSQGAEESLISANYDLKKKEKYIFGKEEQLYPVQ